MKRTLLTILLFIVGTVSALTQDKSLTLNVENVQLANLFKIIEEESGYRFFYNNDEVDVSQKVSVHVTNKPIEEILNQIFTKLPYSFRKEGNNLILIETKRETKNTESAPQPSLISIAGVVTNMSGAPLPGVTVVVKNGKTGTVTDLNGRFSLEIGPDASFLIFSFVGMRTFETPIGEKRYFSVTLTEEAIGLNEIVVIGYGSVKKTDLTGSVAVVSTKDLNRVSTGNLSNAIQGRASGVFVTQSGVPGSGGQIKIRGIGSINQVPNPIYVIDGIVTGSATMATINPTDIESIQVLKDASAAAIYGADGANGVIIITTKRGEKGSPKISLSSFTSLHRVPRQFDVMNADEYAQFYSTLLEEHNLSIPVSYQDHFRQWYYGEGWQRGTSWQDEINRTAYGQNHNLRIAGGGNNSNYSVSLNYFGEDGVLISSSYDRYNMRVNSDFKLNKFIKFGETLSLTRSISKNPSAWQGNPWNVSLIASPLMRIYNETNKGGFEGPQISYEYIMPDGTVDIVSNTGSNDKINPYAPLKLGDFKTYSNHVLASLYLQIEPLKWLSLKTTPSLEGSFNRTKNWFPAFDLGVRSRNQAELHEEFYEGISLSWENQVTFSGSYGRNNLTATAVHHVRKNEANNVEVSARGFPYEQLNVIGTSYENGRQVTGGYFPFTSESYLGRVIYDFDNKYLLTASLRHDGNSRFGPANRWGTFPSVSVGWKINEDFFSEVEAISLAKIRFGWGETGNSSIGSFQYQSVLDDFNQFSPVFGVEQRLVSALNVVHSFGNPSIKWEAAEMINIGADVNLFGNKLQFSAEYYIKNQDDLLVKIPVSAAFGRVSGEGDPWVNLGEIQNRGFEISSYYTKMSGNFNYNLSANFSHISNSVKYIPGEIVEDNNITTPGHTIGSFYGYIAERIITPRDFNEQGDYLYAKPELYSEPPPANTEIVPSPGDLKFKDLNADGRINELDRTIIGKALPDFMYSLNAEVFYKNFDFSVLFFGMQNFDIYNHLRAEIEGFSSQDMGHNKSRAYALNYYRDDRPSTKYVRADINNLNRNNRPSTWYLEDGSFLRIKNIQFGYTLPGRITRYLQLTRTRLFMSATNILTVTNYSGRDPEAPLVSQPLTPGNDKGAYPVPRVFTVGVQVDF